MRRHLLKMGKSVFLLLVVVVVVSQAQSQSLSARSGRLQGQSRRPNGPRLQQGSIVRAASSGARKPSGAEVNVKPNIKPNINPNATPSANLSTRQGAKAQPRRPKLTAGKAQLSASAGSFGFTKEKCKGNCNFPAEVCVKKAKCGGPSCFFCAETKSLPKFIEKKPKPSPTPPSTNFGFGGMDMNNLGMLGMQQQQQQQQPTDFFSDIFGLGPSNGGGFDMFGTGQTQMGNQQVSSGFPNSLFSTNPLTSIPVAGYPSFHQMDFLNSFSGNSQSSSGPSINSPSLFGGLFGGGSGGMGGGGGMNLLSMSMFGMDPFQLF
ncbi:uncharacterized protein LOC110460753 isoform X1 [Mizuhopecten yessoensis]|uniref:uncharacterized protein LOC110460753 isoform X1 n=1 Tax=Mizuhopecten yessoensis TaxID=6573 RepID=UPI000B45AEBA|nr:uncharacterized protein LOC110460753 isoform X1 [Mizuhopecten yessoensis]